VWIEQHHTVVRDASGAAIAIECIARNVTERRSLEEQFQQSQKMEAVGRLAGGVAHDFNNLLTVILGYSAQLLAELPADDVHLEELDEINKAGERAAALTRQLLAFSRRQVLQPQVLDLNTVVADMERMLVRLLAADIRYVTVAAPEPARVRADCGQMEQVLMNLVVNARDAMPNGGTLTVEVASAAPYVTLAVRDTGVGMDEATQRRIFEPFFTTKPAGVGTGLGLSTVYGIVTQSGGSVSVKSQVGAGTTFTVALPAIEKASEIAGEDRRTAAPAGGKGTILVVEDEAAVRNLICAVLKRAGYQVLAASDGAEARLLSEDHPGEIHLLLTDMVMPGTRGDELARYLKSSRPDLRVLLMSGYTDQTVGELAADVAFLQKPFTPSSLSQAVRRALES
jgi:nitrogen-specific signal transduction histidine kinase